MSKDKFINDVAKRIEFTENVPASILRGSIFRSCGPPSELCDGGDYIKEIQIRVENKRGDIYLSLKPQQEQDDFKPRSINLPGRKNDEWWSGIISWEEFFDLLMSVVKNNDQFQHHTLSL